MMYSESLQHIAEYSQTLIAKHSKVSNLDNGSLILSSSLYVYIAMCVQLLSPFIKECNKVSITSAYCSALAHGTAAVDNDRKRWWLTQWKTKIPVTILNFFLGFIGDSIIRHSETHTSSNDSPFLEMALSSSNFTLPRVTKRVPRFMHMCALYTTT